MDWRCYPQSSPRGQESVYHNNGGWQTARLYSEEGESAAACSAHQTSKSSFATHYAGVAGADVGLRLPVVPHREVVGLLLELGPVQRPRLLPAQVALLRHAPWLLSTRLPSSPERGAEHRLLLNMDVNHIKYYE